MLKKKRWSLKKCLSLCISQLSITMAGGVHPGPKAWLSSVSLPPSGCLFFPLLLFSNQMHWGVIYIWYPLEVYNELNSIHFEKCSHRPHGFFKKWNLQFSSVQLLSHVQLFGTLWTAERQASLSITNSWSLLKLMSFKSMMPSNHLILCRPLLLLPSIFPSIRVFSNESVLHIRWPKYWSFSFSISPSNEYSGMISFRMDWLDLLAVQGTLKSLLQHHSSKASVLWRSAFFIAQLSHPYMTTGKTIALTSQTFVRK